MKKIVVVGGLGVVGNAVAVYFNSLGYEISIVDTRHGIGVKRMEDALGEEDYIFVCVPTPMADDGSVDTSIVEKVSIEIARISASRQHGAKVIFKSTMVPGSTTKMVALMKMLNPRIEAAYNPEFLRQRCPIEDMMRPTRIVVGSYDINFTKEVMRLYDNTMAPKYMFDSFEGAELVKYYTNSYYAMRISFFNQMKEFADFHEQNHEFLVKCVVADMSVGMHGSNPTGQPYGGACLPKDVSAIIRHGKSLGIDTKFLKCAKRMNDILLNRQKFESMNKWVGE